MNEGALLGGILTHAGEIRVEKQDVCCLIITCDRQTLAAAKTLPMYEHVCVVPTAQAGIDPQQLASLALPKLHLHVKTEYFDQIRSGEKTEEYRLHNAYWVKRLVEFPEGKARPFAAVVIYNAYKGGAENRIEFPWRGWRLTGRTHPHFGPDEVTVFAIKLERPTT